MLYFNNGNKLIESEIMDVLKQIEEQMKNNVDPSYNEDFRIIQERLAEAWKIYDDAHLAYNVPAGSELYHMGKFLDFAIDDFHFDLRDLDEQFIDWPEDPYELAEEMRQQEEYRSNLEK
jgi:hypothetical protein